ncbi:MAG: ABC transporter permease [Chlamydiae bacterium]|nr:ABC transporter permease [Chlamydiota bacterium]
MNYSIIDFFTDPVLRGPTWGSIFMCISSSIAGVIVLLRKRSLLGEALSHASYPGVALGVSLFASFFSPNGESFAIFVLVTAFFSSLLGMFAIDFLQKHFFVKADAALCFVLSSFFGLGVLISSRIQTTHATWYKQVQAFLYGQTATMRDVHIIIYLALCVVTISIVTLLYREIQLISFDKLFGRSLGLNFNFVETAVIFLTVLAIVIGIRSVGVVMMAGMLIAPALAAKQIAKSLKSMFFISASIGAFCGFLGNYFSVLIPYRMGASKLSLPTGPMILVFACIVCFFSLLFSFRTGIVAKYLRMKRFKRKCHLENFLKGFWRRGPEAALRWGDVAKDHNTSPLSTFYYLRLLVMKGWLTHKNGLYAISPQGTQKAMDIVRLHRLWELYLVYTGHSKDKVHASAEEMEHILTPDMERQITEVLNDPDIDPHNQPIPKR